MKPLNALTRSQLADQCYQRWHLKIDPRLHAIEDVFRPEFWAHGSRLAVSDIVRVEATDGSYDIDLVVVARSIAGKPAVRVSLWPKMPPPERVLGAAVA